MPYCNEEGTACSCQYGDYGPQDQPPAQPSDGGGNWWDKYGKGITNAGAGLLGNLLEGLGSSMGNKGDWSSDKAIQYPAWAEAQRKKGTKGLNQYGRAISQGPIPPSPFETGMDQTMYNAYLNGGFMNPEERVAKNQFMNLGTRGWESYFPAQDYATMLSSQLGTLAPQKAWAQSDYMDQMARMFPQLGTRGGQVQAAGQAYNQMLEGLAKNEQGIYSDVYGKQAAAKQQAMLSTPQIQQMGLNQAQNYGLTPQTASQWYAWAGVPRTREQQSMDWMLGQQKVLNEMRRAWAQLGYGAPMGSTTNFDQSSIPWYATLLGGAGKALAGAIA